MHAHFFLSCSSRTLKFIHFAWLISRVWNIFTNFIEKSMLSNTECKSCRKLHWNLHRCAVEFYWSWIEKQTQRMWNSLWNYLMRTVVDGRDKMPAIKKGANKMCLVYSAYPPLIHDNCASKHLYIIQEKWAKWKETKQPTQRRNKAKHYIYGTQRGII